MPPENHCTAQTKSCLSSNAASFSFSGPFPTRHIDFARSIGLASGDAHFGIFHTAKRTVKSCYSGFPLRMRRSRWSNRYSELFGAIASLLFFVCAAVPLTLGVGCVRICRYEHKVFITWPYADTDLGEFSTFFIQSPLKRPSGTIIWDGHAPLRITKMTAAKNIPFGHIKGKGGFVSDPFAIMLSRVLSSWDIPHIGT